MITVRTTIILVCFIGLFGCATQSHSSSEATFTGKYNNGDLHPQTLYDILLAELSGNAENYQYSLDKYLKQSELTQDAGIAKRAVRIAQHLRDTKALTKAVKLWIVAAPDEPEPYQLLANILITQSKFSEALPHFNKALDLGQNKVLLMLSAQLKKMSKADINAYIDLLNDIKVKKDIESDKLVTLALLYAQLQEYPQAIEKLESALTLTPDYPTALYQMAEVLKSLGRYSDSLTTLDKLLIKHPNDRQFNALQIQLLFSLHRNQQATDKIDLLLKEKPEDSARHHYLGLTAFDFNELALSMRIFKHILKENPANSSPYFYLGIIAERADLYPDAIDNYLKVTTGKNILQAHTRAISLHKNGTDKPKVEKITAQLIHDNNSAKTTYLLMLADWLKKFNFTAQAIAVLDKQILVEPKNTDLLYARAMYLEPLDFSAAEQDFLTVLQITPNNPIILNAFGYTLTVHTDRYSEALTLIEKALALSPEDPATIDSMGWVLYKLKRYEEAITFLSKAFSLYNDPEVASHLIEALASANQIKEANRLFLKINSSHPDNKFVKKARLFLEKQ